MGQVSRANATLRINEIMDEGPLTIETTGTTKAITLQATGDIALNPVGADITLGGVSGSAGKFTLAGTSLSMYGGDTTADDLFLYANSTDANPKVSLNGLGNVDILIKDQDHLVSYDGSNYLKTEVSSAGAVTMTPTGASAAVSVASDLSATGHSDSREFVANAFQYPNPGTDWTPELNGAGLAANLAAKKCWLPLNFLKIGDEIVSYKLTGDAVEAAAITLDCKLVSINLADPITTTDVTGGGIVQVDADGDFDVEATLGAVETVATDKMYTLEVLGTCGAADAITVMGAEVKVNRKV